MKKPFERREYSSQTFFQKLFRILPKENSIVELNNLLAEKGANNIIIDDIAQISSKYRVNLYKDYHNYLVSFYKDFLEYCLLDKKLSEEEIRILDNLKFVLNLNDKDIKDIYDKVVQNIYKKEAKNAISDGILSKEEERFLLEMEHNLQIPHDLAMSIYGEESQELFTKIVKEVISDQKLSPDEEKQLQLLSENLHIKLDFDTGTKSLLNKYKLFWQIDNGMLPEIKAEINLQKGEVCHFYKNSVNWLEQRSITRRINYSGLSYRVNICKGLSWRVGSISPQSVSEDIWKIIDTGDLYLTNKRIIFMGSKGNKTITFNKILDFVIYTNGIDIQKDAGKSPFLEFDTIVDVFGMILGKILMEK